MQITSVTARREMKRISPALTEGMDVDLKAVAAKRLWRSLVAESGSGRRRQVGQKTAPGEPRRQDVPRGRPLAERDSRA